MNGRDLTAYNRLAHGDGHEPASADSFDPQFTGPSALGEGQSFVGNSLGNVAMSFPLILDAANTDALYQLIRDIRTDLVKGNTVEYRSGGASQSTFFDMESGKLEPNFEFWLDQNARCRAQLTIWRRPYGHTGTSRVIASAAGTGPMTVTATGVLGDVDAKANLTVRRASASGGIGQGAVVFGVKYPVPSGFNPIWNASRIAAETLFPVGTTVSATSLASGRISNSFRAVLPIGSAMALGTWTAQPIFLPVSKQTYAGRYRMLVNIRNRIALATYANRIEAVPFVDGLELPARRSLATAQNWAAFDLGEITIPSVGATSTFGVNIWGVNTASPVGSIVATYPIQVDGVSLIPVDINAGIANATGWGLGASSVLGLNGIDGSVLAYETQGATPLYDAGKASVRGQLPELPPTGSPAASGAAQIFVWSAPAAATSSEPLGNSEHRVTVTVRERFSYMR